MSFPLFKNEHSFYKDYEMPLQQAFYSIEKRGLLVDPLRLRLLKKYIQNEKEKVKTEIFKSTGQRVVFYKAERTKDELCINAPKQLISFFKSLGLKVPTNRQTQNETTNQEAIEQMFAESGHPVLRQILRGRELVKNEGTYVNAKLYKNVLYCTFLATGTVGGRRSSRENFLGLGTNFQNLPKHSDLGAAYRHCIVSRPGKIFLQADLKSGEDWIVHGIIADNGGPLDGIRELGSNINRHKQLAHSIFGIEVDKVGKDSLEYYLAKRSRHGFNYGMQGFKQSRILATEGIGVNRNFLVMSDGKKTELPLKFLASLFLERKPKAPSLISFCEYANNTLDQNEPQIRKVFQRYVIDKLLSTRRLVTPIGRTRDFFALRPGSDNGAAFRDGFSYIPQSTVGDLTGLSILELEDTAPNSVLSDGHDAVVLEVEVSPSKVYKAIRAVEHSYRRTITFENGFTCIIPTEVEIGFTLSPKDMVSICLDDLTETGLKNTLNILAQSQRAPNFFIGGQPPQLLELLSNETSGSTAAPNRDSIQTCTPC